MKNKTLSAHIALFLVNTLYGASHVLAKGVMPAYLTPNVFILFRAFGATVLFWMVKAFFVRERVERKDLLLLAFCGLFGVAINQLFFFHGLNFLRVVISMFDVGLVLSTQFLATLRVENELCISFVIRSTAMYGVLRSCSCCEQNVFISQIC